MDREGKKKKKQGGEGKRHKEGEKGFGSSKFEVLTA